MPEFGRGRSTLSCKGAMMPAILVNCVRELQENGKDKDAAWAICVARLGPKGSGLISYDTDKGEYVLTEKGKTHEAGK